MPEKLKEELSISTLNKAIIISQIMDDTLEALVDYDRRQEIEQYIDLWEKYKKEVPNGKEDSQA